MKLCDTSETPNSCSLTSLTVPNEGTYTVNANGTVTFDPLPTFTGTATAITYQAVDDLGQYVSATITPSVTAPATPVAVNDTSTDFLNMVQTKNPLSNDTTADPLITLDPTSVRLCGTGETAPACTATSVSVANGSYSVNTTTGVVSFTPDTNWSGTAPAVTYQVTDSTNQKTSATYTPTVYPKPTASNDTSSGAYDTNQVISPFSNDGFADSAPVVASSLKLCGSTQTPNNCTQTSLTVAGEGTYTVNANGTVTFDPLPTFRGTATAVTYQAADTSTLLWQLAGWSIPLHDMPLWLRGLPGNKGRDIVRDEFGRVTSFTLTDSTGIIWQLEYQSFFSDSLALPRRIVLSSSDSQIKVVVRSWQ